ncbi:EpsG family protein [Paenibacillus pseudetheri]|uniref:EpsG family protein n=1 Tax=Paenibacillus pseudetheri TaxID=2897682 RepID=A0ABN8FIW1_9BACL|nr:EpsG family protein [Paenibacillus pseudetheri]CAH1057988.1 hypothetical protein PAECIP111894_04161 [Paenibacillus pseudetheri]
MWVYIVNVALIMYWWFLYTVNHGIKSGGGDATSSNVEQRVLIPQDHKKRNFFTSFLILLPFVQVYMILALKNINVGTDTVPYLTGFHEVTYLQWSTIFDLTVKNPLYNFERGFIFISKMISTFTDNFKVYNAIMCLLMILPVYKFIKKHSAMPFLSVLIFITFGFMNFYLSGMRQAIALSIILFSFNFIVDRKIWKFLATIAIASLFHVSAVVFFPAYFLISFTFTPALAIAYIVSLGLIYILRFNIIEFVTQYFYSGSSITNTGAYTLMLIVIVSFIAGLLFYKKAVTLSLSNKIVYNLIAVAAALMIFNTTSNIALRVANYYYIFMLLFIPAVLKAIDSLIIRNIATAVVVIFTLTYYFKSGIYYLQGFPYSFYWE